MRIDPGELDLRQEGGFADAWTAEEQNVNLRNGLAVEDWRGGHDTLDVKSLTHGSSISVLVLSE
jgi:hypothetical protein